MFSQDVSPIFPIDAPTSEEIVRVGCAEAQDAEEGAEEDPVPELVPVTDEDDEAVAPASPLKAAKETQDQSKEVVLYKRTPEDMRITFEMISTPFIAYDASFQLNKRYCKERVKARDGEGIETWWAALPDAPLGGNHQVENCLYMGLNACSCEMFREISGRWHWNDLYFPIGNQMSDVHEPVLLGKRGNLSPSGIAAIFLTIWRTAATPATTPSLAGEIRGEASLCTKMVQRRVARVSAPDRQAATAPAWRPASTRPLAEPAAAGLTSMIDMVQARIRELDHATSTPANVAAARRTQAREARAATVSPLYCGLGANPTRFRQTRNCDGARQIRETPLTQEDLWVDGIGPLEQPAPQQDHHECGVCHRVKSHPVSLWLEHDWGCPECSLKMSHAPFRHHAEEASIVAAYPNWRDESRVEYRWDGLFVLKTDSRRRGVNDEFGRRDAVLGPTSRLPNRAAKRFALLSHVPRLSHSPNGVSLDLTTSFFSSSPMGRHADARNDLLDADYGDRSYEQTEATLTADLSVYLSSNGRRRLDELLNVGHKKRRVQPSDLDDSYAQWIPVPDDGYDDMVDRDSDSNPLNAVGSTPAIPGTKKRKEYASSDDPMSLWRPLKGLFSDEIICHDGLGDDLDAPRCAHCQAAYGGGTQIFKCLDCGQHLQCKLCCLSRHLLMPLHIIKEWGGHFWLDRSLAEIGLVYQLGHGGLPCIFPDERVYKMTVIEAPIIHQIRVHYCKCERSDHADNLAQLLRNAWYPASVTDPGTCATFKTLEAYRLYNVVGNMNVNDFIHAMERATDVTAATGIRWLPGRVHDPAGVDETKLGECAVQCWACPQDGKNLPSNWRDVDPKYKFLYMLLLAVDANFKLKNRMRPNEIDDPPLGPGWSYWVEQLRYKLASEEIHRREGSEHLYCLRCTPPKRYSLDYRVARVSGVGGCVCARHECVRPNGIGDLQKGESGLRLDAFGHIKGLLERNAKMPRDIRLPLDKITYQCALPVWHAASHNEDCKENNSLSFKPGVGKSDGEGVERVWSVLNPASYQTKDAGRGQRVDVLEDKIDSHNFQKNIGQAIAERERQVAGFKEISATVEHDVKKEWKAMIDAWLADPSQPNPYTLSRKDTTDCLTEAEVRLEVQRDEDAVLAEGRSPLQGSSATAFLTAGLQIEVAQRRILTEIAGTALVTADREGKLHEWRRTLLVKIGTFRDLQRRFMLGAAHTIAQAEAARDVDDPPPKPEKIRLFMPRITRDGGKALGCPMLKCARQVTAHGYTAKRHLIIFRNDNIAGQVHATKAATLIEQLGERVNESAEKYQRGRTALISLRGAEACQVEFPELRPVDVQLDGDAGESDAAARKKLAMIGAGRGARAPRDAPGMSKRLMSWIWTAPGALDDEEERLHDPQILTRFLQLSEWNGHAHCARKVRWEEEVLMLREEMRRVLRMLGWLGGWWRARADLRSEVSPDIAAGLRAFALKQGDWHDKLAAFFERKWKMPALAAARHLVALETAAAEEGADLDQFFAQ
ncbi:hypothetical protein B0H11DRAFT_1911569 [Mycena galericulata]|nr:hypothetical protein B0H11DRAFT_1911569 [Mycena galericulata]